MGERKLESVTAIDNRFLFYTYPMNGFSLRFVSGPEDIKNVTPGWWLDTWEIVAGKRRFSFGPQNNVVFATKETAVEAQTELKKAVDVITEVVE